MIRFHIFFAFLALIAIISAQKCPKYRVRVFSKAARRKSRIKGIVSKFQRQLGGIDNVNGPGPLPNGRRSINWDAPGAILPFDMPFHFFNSPPTTRGAIFRAKGNEFRVSNPAPAHPAEDDKISSLLPSSVTNRFQTFSDPRLFTPLKSNILSVLFRIPATNKKATTFGFGAIFTDVDILKEKVMWFYDRNGCLIYKLYVKPANKGLSFGGIIIKDWKKYGMNPPIWRVVIKLGTVSVERFADKYRPGSGKGDVVVLDDLFFGELS